MKKALKLVLTYFLTFLLALLIGTLVYLLTMDIQGFVSGQKMNFFDRSQFIQALFLVANGICFIIGPFLCYYRIRHSYGLPQTIAYCVMMALTWGVIFPAINKLEDFCYEHLPVENQISHLSGKYFRQNGDKVFYFTRDFYSNSIAADDTNTVIINTSENGEVEVKRIKDRPYFELYTAASPYKEIQTKKTFDSDTFETHIDLKFLILKGQENFAAGWTFYLGFISIGLVIAALFAVSSFFEWKLLNTCFVIIGTAGILILNSLMYTDVFGVFIQWAENIGFVKSLKNIFDNPALVIVNVLCALLLIAIGLLNHGIKKHRRKNAE